MAARSEYFRSYHLLMLSAEQNDSQSEEINVIDESQAEIRPVFVQETEKNKSSVKFETRNRHLQLRCRHHALGRQLPLGSLKLLKNLDSKRNQRNIFFLSRSTEEETSNLSYPTTEC